MTACRLRYLDNLRILLCFLVVAHHAGQPYGPSEGAWPVHYPQSSALLAPFFSVNAAFFMGAFFFTAGLMMPAALRRAGKWGFLVGRVRRLILPALVVGLMAAPPVVWAFGMAGVGQPFWPWWLWQVVGSWQPILAHTWFLVHLALYAALYAALAPWLQLVRVDQLSHGRIVALIAGMALSQYLLRIPFPIDHWVTIARTVPVEPAHLPQYACLFWLGILAGQGSFLRTFPDRIGFVWLAIGLAAAVLRYGQVYLWRGVGTLPQITATGGAGWPSLVWCVWESVMAVGLTLGLVAAFRRWCDRGGPIIGWIAAASFAVYLIHPFIIVPIQAALVPTGWPPFVLFLLVTGAGMALSLLAVLLLPTSQRALIGSRRPWETRGPRVEVRGVGC